MSQESAGPEGWFKGHRVGSVVSTWVPKWLVQKLMLKALSCASCSRRMEGGQGGGELLDFPR